MSDGCTPKGYRQIFSEKNAAGEAKRYRRKRLDGTSKRIFDFIRDGGVEGKTLLEAGGGIGAVEIELLKAGMARAVNVELTPPYEAAAGELLVEAGLRDRVERKVMDFAEAGPELETADVVVMNRVDLLLSGHAQAGRRCRGARQRRPGDELSQRPMVDAALAARLRPTNRPYACAFWDGPYPTDLHVVP